MDLLAAKRISRDPEASSALKRQDAELREAIADGGHNLVHMVEDATVSGAINLDQRKSLGEWLREPKVHEWQALMVTTQDRITGDDLHWHQLVGWCLENGKHVIVLDDPGLDISTPRGRLVAGVKASMTADYRHAVKDKRAKQTAYYRDVDLWHGGNWPWGYRTVRKEHEGKKRWVLAVDPVTSALAYEAHTRIVKESWALNRLRVDWNVRAVMTPRDHQRHVNATLGPEGVSTEVKGAKWTVNQLEAVLTSPRER
ncbi:recombinase family protein [Phytomonospora endophytica]|uniref:DNA invertase Pin-like site-specific DNA recombinase n=1 Tax=Phytomonospora endophytica TaxID=714109 RepID=A0A841FKQ3_9ACTN|nr:recombinase family protein [Phytomonospora endophytica]MBB6033757.1 DNA invertase Pin-like site-specific DNA recombinase [Phytomonospora endophytica]GIG64726.1 hypothetical protein Pen01_10210 [Phytomonospora endophytica]